jgi:hypothetical protein
MSFSGVPHQPGGGLLFSPCQSPTWGMTIPPILGYTTIVP